MHGKFALAFAKERIALDQKLPTQKFNSRRIPSTHESHRDAEVREHTTLLVLHLRPVRHHRVDHPAALHRLLVL